MRCLRYALVSLLALTLMATAAPIVSTQSRSEATIAQFLGAASPVQVVAARNVDRIAWIAYEQGKRNVYTAAAPAFAPVRLTQYVTDNGVELTNVRISADGSTVVFVRGSAANRQGWHANPASDPNGVEEAIWAARTATPGISWRVVAGSDPQLSPDGRWVLVTKDGQIHRASVSRVRAATEMDRGEKPFISLWGTNSNPAWSPDGTRIAFVSNRGDHSFVGVYHGKTRTVTYMAPGVDFDANPVWSADGSRITFIRRPGTPFGQQTQQGAGGIGTPPGAALQAAGRGGQGRGGRGTGGRGAQEGQAAQPGAAPAAQVAGLTNATFKGGYSLSIWDAEVASGEGREVWHNQPRDPLFSNIASVRWAGDRIIFPIGGGGGGRGRGGSTGLTTGGQGAEAGPRDEWDRYYSLDVTKQNATPVLLTTTDGLIEDATSSIVSHDGKTFFYCTNAKDSERRHIWAVPTSGGQPRQVTTGQGIETYPAPLASGTRLATLSATWNMPQSLGIWSISTSTSTASQKIIFPAARPGFPADAHVEPKDVVTKAPDGVEIHNQLFVPKNIRPGEKRPAMIFVHGGPARQMLLGYHYRYGYHIFYGANQWLANHGYVVLSVNYRGGVGYGRSFQGAPNRGANGNAEYQDVVAGAKYLQSRPDVDPERIGIYGLSYGGILTAQALARNSDIFKVGVDYAGVHLYGSSLDPDSVSYQSSAISHIDKWKSPVLIISGDDDRNVAFSQTVGLVQLLRQRDVYHELIVFPDDVHSSVLHSRWVYLLGRTDTFLQKFIGDSAPRRITSQ